jgi:hypothetical protein
LKTGIEKKWCFLSCRKQYLTSARKNSFKCKQAGLTTLRRVAPFDCSAVDASECRIEQLSEFALIRQAHPHGLTRRSRN